MTSVVGWGHTICISDSGEVYTFGRNDVGQLGLGHHKQVSIPTLVPTLSKIRSVSCGYRFIVCADEKGIVWSFGDNVYGQLGTENTESYNIPQKILDIPPIQSVACGGYHSLFIDNNNNLWSVGRNDFGQLAIGTKNSKANHKIKQTSFTNILKICAGYCFSLFQNEKDEIYSCGDNSRGELGWGIWETEKYQISQIFNQPPGIIQFCCGLYHSLFLDDEGKVFGVGINASGSLGVGDNANRSELVQIQNILPMQKILCAGYSSYSIDFDGNVWSFGLNTSGQLGLGDKENRNVPTKIPTISDIVEMSSGSFGYHFLAKNSQSGIFVGGDNQFGQLGNNKTELSIPEIMKAEYFPIWGTSLKSRGKSARK